MSKDIFEKLFSIINHQKKGKSKTHYHLTPARIAIVKEDKSKPLIRIWRKGNPDILLVEMKIDSAFIENRMEDLQNNKNKTTTWSLLGIYPK